MQYRTWFSAVLAALITTSCAELGTALENANQTLEELNGSHPSGSTTKREIVKLLDEDNARFRTRNLKLIVENAWHGMEGTVVENCKSVAVEGEVYNKTDRVLDISYSLPTYSERGSRTGSIFGAVAADPYEWTELGTSPDVCTHKFDANKFRITARSFKR